MVKNSLELAKLIAKASDDKKARDVVMMNMEGLSTATDYFVVCSASSTTQVRAIADNVEDVLREQEGMEFLRKEGYREAEWVLLDYGDVVLHVFQQDAREYYALEQLWGDADLTTYVPED